MTGVYGVPPQRDEAQRNRAGMAVLNHYNGGLIMAIGKRIKFFRNRKGMTQKQLGEILGFLGKTSDVRMAQYESD